MFDNHKWTMWSSIDYNLIVKTSLITEPIINDYSVPTEELKLKPVSGDMPQTPSTAVPIKMRSNQRSKSKSKPKN